jgi:hypothetical protein
LGDHLFAPSAEFDLVSRGRSHDENVDGQIFAEMAPCFRVKLLKCDPAQLVHLFLVLRLDEHMCGKFDDGPDCLDGAVRLASERLGALYDEACLERIVVPIVDRSKDCRR